MGIREVSMQELYVSILTVRLVRPIRRMYRAQTEKGNHKLF